MSFCHDSCAGSWEAVFHALFCDGGSISLGMHVHTRVYVVANSVV